jgi:hypothetical protein
MEAKLRSARIAARQYAISAKTLEGRGKALQNMHGCWLMPAVRFTPSTTPITACPKQWRVN